MKVEVKFVPQDMWVGLYWKKETWLAGQHVMRDITFYLCLLPMLPIILNIILSETPVELPDERP